MKGNDSDMSANDYYLTQMPSRRQIADMTPREQLNFALCGDKDDDDTYIIEDKDED
jgi:hypothetical protein